MLYLNDGQNPVHWTSQEVDSYCGWSHWVDTADFNNDGFIDIVSANFSETSIKWYENNGSNPISWTQHTVNGTFQYGLTAYTADINNDGNMDIVGTAGDRQVSWFENSGGDNITWTRHYIKSNYRYPWGLFVADMDNDEDNDVIAGSNYYGNIFLFKNGLNVNSIGSNCDNLFTTFSLNQNYPNPFNPSTTINFTISEAGSVQLKIYNIEGQLVKSLLNERKTAGEYSVKWNGTNNSGNKISSGVYFYKLTSNNISETKRMILLK